MQSRALLNRLKRLQRKKLGNKKAYIFFGQPSRSELNGVPPSAKVIIFVGENEILE